jgi:hypothetical protein
MTAKSDSGWMNWMDLDVIRVVTEPITSQAVMLNPLKRVLFERHEVVRVCAERTGVFFVVPYLCDPQSERVIQHAVWPRQFRNLNPVERAYLGLQLHGGWDRVTRYGYGDNRGHGLLDPTLDPRDFEIGPLFERRPEDLPACQRELHRWPVVGRVDSRPLSGGGWEPVSVGGREGLHLEPVHAQMILQELERNEYEQRNRAAFKGVEHTFREFRLSWRVTLPTPYDPLASATPLRPTRSGLDVPADSRSLAFRVLLRGSHLGRVFVALDEAMPWRAAFDAVRHLTDGAVEVECCGPTPSSAEPTGYVPQPGTVVDNTAF